MLTTEDLQAIDKLVQKRVESSEKRMIKHMDKRILATEAKLTKYFEKLFNFLDGEVVKLKDRVEHIEKHASFH